MTVDPGNLQAKVEARIQLELARSAADPEYYIFNHVRTVDQHDRDNPIKKFPDLRYLRYFVRHIFGSNEQIEYIIKSRQIMISWILVAIKSWELRFHPFRYCYLQSKKDYDARMMIYMQSEQSGRLNLIESNLPIWMRNRFVGRDGWIEGEINYAAAAANYPNGSIAFAIPQGPAQIESHVPSLYISDESSLQDQWKASMAAARPAIQKDSKGIAAATSRPPSDYNTEMEVTVDGLPADESWTPVEFEGKPLKGVFKYRSRHGTSAHAIHYSADPHKDPDTPEGRQWRDGLASTYPGGIDGILWQQHMEINFKAYEGRKLFPEWIGMRDYVIVHPQPTEPGMQFYSGFDYGKANYTCWYVIAIWEEMEGQEVVTHRRIIKGFEGKGEDHGGIPGIAKQMKNHPLFERVNGRIQADPSLWNKDQSTMGGYKSKADIFSECGVRMVPAKSKGKDADDVLIERLKYTFWADYTRPTLVIESDCKVLLEQWPRLRFKEFSPQVAEQRAESEELVDRKNDSWDAVKYAEASRPSVRRVKVKPPRGSFLDIKNSINNKLRDRSISYR